MLARAIITTAVPLIPCHHLLILRRIGAVLVADAIGSGVQRFEVSGLAEAGPDGLVGGLLAAACLCGLVEELACLGASWQALGEQLGGSEGGGEEGEGGGGEHGGEMHGGRLERWHGRCVLGCLDEYGDWQCRCVWQGESALRFSCGSWRGMRWQSPTSYLLFPALGCSMPRSNECDACVSVEQSLLQ